MNRSPNLHRRRRKSARRPARFERKIRSGFETLEERRLLASAPLPFAIFSGFIAIPNQKASIAMSVGPGSFHIPSKQVLLELVVENDSLDAYSPGPIQIASKTGAKLVAATTGRTVGGVRESTALVRVSTGSLTVKVSALAGSIGNFGLNVFLAGDVNGDFRVSQQDVNTIKSLIGKRSVSPGLLASADLNEDGKITQADVNLAQANLNASTPVRPLYLSTSVARQFDPTGTGLVSQPNIVITGVTEPRVVVSLYDINHPTAVTHVTADTTGHFQVPFTVGVGFTFVQATASDAFGQHGTFRLTIDRLSPNQPTIIIQSPPPLDLFNTNVSISGTVTNTGSIQAQVDSGAAVPVTFDSKGHFQFTTALPLDGTADGVHSVHFTAAAKSGTAKATTALTFTLDDQPPRIAVSTPANGSTTNNDAVAGTVSDNVSGVKTLYAQLDSSAEIPVSVNGTTGAFQFSGGLNLSGRQSDGPHTLTLSAIDFAGNVATAIIQFTINTVPPTAPSVQLAAADQENGIPTSTANAQVALVGQTDPNITVALAGTGITALTTSTGAFQIPGVPLALGDDRLTVVATNKAGNTSQTSATIHRDPGQAGANQVITWDQIALQEIEDDASTPEYASRGLAIMSASVYDALNSIDGTPGYYVKVTAPADASAAAAVATAAYTALSYLYPAQQTFLNSSLTAALGSIADGQSKADGEAVGQSVANAIIAMRKDDGSTDFVDYTPGSASGDWQPTAPAYAPAENPQWATLKPFAMTSDSQFRPPTPAALTSAEYAADVNQTLNLGYVNSTTRTADETQAALFWNDKAGTYTPPGHWNSIADAIAQQSGASLSQDARIFAELNIALADAAIVAWDAKYTYATWRPITLAGGAGTAVNSQIETVAHWVPLLTTPPFPEYVSGHSTFSAAAAAVLTAVFGDNYHFSATSIGLPVVMRTFTSFEQAAQEAGMSRIYGGIHFIFSDTEGLNAGSALGAYVLQTFAVNQDKTPPIVTFTTSLPAGATNTNLSITGRVTDSLSGVAALSLSVDNHAYLALPFDPATGDFSFPTTFALNGSQDGPHTFSFSAVDAAGNAASLKTFSFVLATRPPSITITSPAQGGSLADGATLAGTVTTTGPALAALNYSFDGGSVMPVAFGSNGTFSQVLDLSRLTAGAHSLTVRATDAARNTASQTVRLTLASAIPLVVTNTTPAAGSSDISETFRPTITFSRLINPATLSGSDFYATDSTGAKVPARVVPSDDGQSAWLFFTNPLPGASAIAITVDGSAIKAADGSLLDAANNGTPGSKLTELFTTVSDSAVLGTTLSGIVADPGPDNKPGTTDDVKAGPDGILMTGDDIYINPIAGVKVYILGQENQTVTSGPDGRFTLTSVPSGDVKLVIDGRTATGAPSGVFYPEMVFDLSIAPGVANTVMGSMGTTQEQAAEGSALGVYLPRLESAILQPVGGTTSTTIGLAPGADQGLTPDQASEYSITVAPDSLVGADGQKMSSGQVGFSTVQPALIRGMLPQGVMQLATTLTIQAPGVATFSTPLAVTFANVYGAAPGSQLDVYSFNHTTGDLEITGTATVSADGNTVTTDPGSGITHPGWFGVTPPGDCGGMGEEPADPTATGVEPLDTGTVNAVPLPLITGETGNLVIPPFKPPMPVSNQPMSATATSGCVMPTPRPPNQPTKTFEITVDGPLKQFMTSSGDVPLDATQYRFTLDPSSSPRTMSATAASYATLYSNVAGGFSGATEDRLYGARIDITETDKNVNGPGTTNTIETIYYLYRWVDVVDANAAEQKSGATAAFLKTFDGFDRAKNIDLRVPQGVSTTFLVDEPFSADDPRVWHFDPKTPDNYHKPVRIMVGDPGLPNGGKIGDLTAVGTSVGNTTVSINIDDKDGFDAELTRVILSLQNAYTERFPDGTYADPEVVYPFTATALTTVMVNGKPAWFVENPSQVQAVSGRFRALFYAFMPSVRAGPGPDGVADDADDVFTQMQLDQLQTVVENQGTALYAAVMSDLAPIASTIVLQRSNQGADVTMTWKDLGKSVYGVTPDDNNQPDDNDPKIRELIGTSGRTDPVTKNTFNKEVPAAAQMWALAQYINTQIKGQSIVAVGIDTNFTDPKVTFAQFVANTVGHELGHTFGLLEGYLPGVLGKGGTAQVRDDGNAPPFDIMNSGAPNNKKLQFEQPRVAILEAAVGIAPNGDRSLADALKLWRDQFNLTVDRQNINGIREASPAPDTDPEVSVAVDSNEFYATSTDSTFVGAITADGPGKDVLTTDFVISNIGYAPLTVKSVNLANASAGFSVGASGVVGVPISPGDSVHLSVQFDPTVAGTAETTLDIESDAGYAPSVLLPISAQAIPFTPVAELSLGANNNLGGEAVGSAVQSPNLATITNQGRQPLTISSIQVEAGGSNFTLMGVPSDLATKPIMLATGQTFTFGVQYTASKAGPERARIGVTSNDPNQPVLSFGVTGTGLGSVIYPHWGNDYVAIEFPNENSSIALRAVSDASGNFSFFLPPEQFYHIAIFDPITGLIANGYGVSPPSGQGVDLTSSLVFQASTTSDTDNDGLPDDVEFAIGSSPTNAYTAGDGIDDFTHVIVDQTNPTGLVPLTTGVVSVVALQGIAQAVSLQGSLQSPQGLTAYVATGSFGLAIVDASHFQKPVVLGQVQLPGNSTHVAVDPALQIAAVASGSVLNLVDVNHPTAPVLLSSVGIDASAVTVYQGIAYAASGSDVVAVDLGTGNVLATEAFSGGSVDDLVVDQGNLYVAVSDGSTQTISKVVLNGGDLPAPVESLGISGHPPTGPLHLAVAGGYLYVGGAGYNTSQQAPGIEVIHDDGSKLTLVGPPSAILAFDVATNGSGLALYTSANPLLVASPTVSLLDLSKPTKTSNVITSFATSGAAEGVAVADGLAFIADGSAGLAILNYLPFDTKGKPPSASISLPGASILGNDGSKLKVAEGSIIPVLAAVSDDVQVHNVELLVNGQVVESAVSAPFNLTVVLPTVAQNGSASVAVQVEAIDTGGNVGLSNMLSLELVRDTAPPQLVSSNVPNGSQVGPHFRTVVLHFSKSLAESSVAAADFKLMSPGGNVLNPQSVQFRADDLAVQLTFPSLALGSYQFRIDAPMILGRNGVPLGSSAIISRFTVSPYSGIWINPSGGNWSDPTNWQSGVVPGFNDDILIDVTDSQGDRPTITYDSGNTEIHSLRSLNPLVLSGGSLTVDATVEVDNAFTLAGGTLRDAQIIAGPGSKPIVAESDSVITLDDVKLDVGLDLSESNDLYLNVADGLTLNATATIAGTSLLLFDGAQTLSGTGDVVLDDSDGIANFALNNNAILMIAQGVTVHGFGEIGSFESGTSTLINQGTITADVAGHSLTVDPGTVQNGGTIGVANGSSLIVSGLTGSLGNVSLAGSKSIVSVDGTGYTVASPISITGGAALNLEGSWSLGAGATITASGATLGIANASGTLSGISLAGSTLDLLGGTGSLAGIGLADSTVEVLGTYSFGQFQSLLTGKVNLVIGPGGVLDNTGATTALNPTTGNLTLAGGKLRGGTVTGAGGADVVVVGSEYHIGDNPTFNTLSGVTLECGLDMTADEAELTITGGLTLDGKAIVTNFSTLELDGPETIGGTGDVTLDGFSYLDNPNDTTITIGPGLTIHGASGTIDSSEPLVNQGTIANDSSADLTVDVTPLTNQGTLHANEGEVYVFRGATNAGTVSAGPGGTVGISDGFQQLPTGIVALSVGGTQFEQCGTISVSGGATFAGRLDITLANGYVPVAGDSIPIITYDTRSGQFTTVNVTGLPSGIAATIVYNSGNVTLLFGNALKADQVVARRPGRARALTPDELAPVIADAIARWKAAGTSKAACSRLPQLHFQITNLPGAELGMQAGNSVWIDADAAGHGWFFDAAAASDRAFYRPGSDGELHARTGSPGAGKMDLLTVVEHEMGHVLDLAETSGTTRVMNETLGTGVRRLPARGSVIRQAATTRRWRPSQLEKPLSAILPGRRIQDVHDVALAQLGTGDHLSPEYDPLDFAFDGYRNGPEARGAVKATRKHFVAVRPKNCAEHARFMP
jgi:hypothetical protein